jgi:pyruvate dehydrogenase E1 component alpha subunit
LFSPLALRQPAGTSIADWASRYGVPSVSIDGNDVFAVRAAALEAVQWCRAGRGPYFLELSTYRWREHVGPNWDYDVDFRSKAEVESWMARCPLDRAADTLRATLPEIDSLRSRWEAESRAEIRTAIDVAKASPFPPVESLLDGTYAN